MSWLAVDDLSVHVGARPLVDRASFRLTAGDAFTLLGETGSGKSLLLSAVAGTLPRELRASGTITVHGEQSAAVDQRAREPHWGRTLAVLPQEPWLALDPTMRILPQVAEGYARVQGQPHDEARRRAGADLTRLALGQAADRYPFMLSGGMAQRAAFAATRASGGRLVLVDEPTKGLDATLRDSLVALLQSVLTAGGALFTITHDVHVARTLGGTVAVMLDGRIVESGPADRVLSTPAHEYTRRLLAAEPERWPQRRIPATGAPVVTARGLAKSFGPHQVFADIDVTLHAGERLAITGPSGSGKTTLGNVLLGLMSPDRGSVSRRSNRPSWKYQKLYQDPVAAFAPRVTIRQSLADVVSRHHLQWSTVDDYRHRLRLADDLLDRRPDQVSGGELQRFALARVLLLEPDVIFADEPTSRLDPISQQETLDVLVDEAQRSGAALMLVTHDPAIATNVGQQVLAPFS
jgi:peptide/nickel transport system ATP-binding protein